MSWETYCEGLCVCDEIGLRLDVSRMHFPADFFAAMKPRIEGAFDEMAALEAGAVANPDEGRQVGHYWLRAPELAPDAEVGHAIEKAVEAVKRFAASVHEGEVAPPSEERFTDLLVIGVGGSALGPQLVADALGDPRRDTLTPHFFDNTDADGMERVLASLEGRLGQTLSVVISKSGGTAETRNGMLVTEAAYAAAEIPFARCAVAVTGEGSRLDRTAESEGWLARFPMWDWVGGRTSETSAVGLLPAALQGLDIDGLLAGAAACDRVTRRRGAQRNPAALLALTWYAATGGRGERDMVILPYRDRLLLFSRYLQQLVMESLGKGRDLDGRAVAQGIAVYGNKGSTDQHAYVQQLREGVDNFFVTFIEVLADGFAGAGGGALALEVEPGITSGDYLRGFLLGTREALSEASRQSLTISLERFDAQALGVLIALFERAVGLYASLVNINAYHQPGVEAGKKAAASVLDLQRRAVAWLGAVDGNKTAAEVAAGLDAEGRTELVFRVLEGLAANGRGVRQEKAGDPRLSTFAVKAK